MDEKVKEDPNAELLKEWKSCPRIVTFTEREMLINHLFSLLSEKEKEILSLKLLLYKREKEGLMGLIEIEKLKARIKDLVEGIENIISAFHHSMDVTNGNYPYWLGEQIRNLEKLIEKKGDEGDGR